MPLTDEEILSFAKNGYLILKDVVPAKQMEDALAVIDKAYEEGNHGVNDKNPKDKVPEFRNDVAKNHKVVETVKGTKLWSAVEQLIGKGSAQMPKLAQVALREPSEYWKGKGWDLHTSVEKWPWHIDGGQGTYAFVGSPFTMLVGICMSEGQDSSDENHGQFLAWPGSHAKLHPLIPNRIKKGLITDPSSVFNDIERPDLGGPIRVPLKPGDAVIVHQRTGHSGGPNLGPHIRKNLYFRVSNSKHDTYLKSGELLNGWVWAEYAGVRTILEKHGDNFETCT